MTRLWIDVEDSSGNNLGDGPITTATGWTYNPTLDEAGSFSFRMPAGDPRAALLVHKRIAHCWMADAGVITDLGGGIIDEVELDPRDPTMLTVSGPDLLAELAGRAIPSLTVCTQALVTLDIDDDLGVYKGAVRWLCDRYGDTSDVDLPEAHDGITDALGETIRLWREADVYADWLYVGHDARFDFARVTISDQYLETNRAETTLVGQYFDGAGWVDLPDLVDGTSGYVEFAEHWATMNQTGDITWTRPADWARITPTAAAGSWFWVRFTVLSGSVTDDFGLWEVQVWADVPTTDGVNQVMAYAPDTWTRTGYDATVAAKYLELRGESVLAALRALAEQGGQGVDTTREHFRLGAGRLITWFSTFTDSGLRAENAIDPGDTLCLITDLQQRRDTTEVVTRLYPQSNEGITLALTTRTPPAGYTMSAATGYIENDAAVAALGQIDACIRFTDLNRQQSDSWFMHPSMLANAVYDRGIEYLRTHCTEQHFYSIELARVRAALVPGNTIRVVYHEYRDTYHAVNIDAVLYVLGTRVRVDEDGLHTVGVEVATVDRSVQTDVGVIRSTIQDVRRMATGQAGIWTVVGGGASAGALGDRVFEGPGIDVTGEGTNKTVGLGGDSVLLYHSDGSPVSEYATITLGLAAASTGNIVEVQADTYTDTCTIPAGVELVQRGANSQLTGTITQNGIRSIPVVQLATDSLLVGPQAGNRTHTGVENTAVGKATLAALTTGYENTAVGARALMANTVGFANTAIGVGAFASNVLADYNTAVGAYAMYDAYNQTNYSVAVGYFALAFADWTGESVAIGASASAYADTEHGVTIGMNAGPFEKGGDNVIIGWEAGTWLGWDAYSYNNIAIGAESMDEAEGGSYNIGIGYKALSWVTTGGDNNVAIGTWTLIDLTTGAYNVAVGGGAGENAIITGQYNTLLGYQAQRHASAGYNASKSIVIGYGAYTTADNTCVIGGAASNAVDLVIGGPTAASAQVHVAQASTTGVQPVLLLDQADVSEEFIRFVGAAHATELTQSIVPEASVTATPRAGWLRVYVQDDGNQIADQAYYVPIYTLTPPAVTGTGAFAAQPAAIAGTAVLGFTGAAAFAAQPAAIAGTGTHTAP